MKPAFNRFLPKTFVLCFAPVLAALAPQAHAEGVFSYGQFTSDATSGVSPAKTYTTIANVIGGAVVVNGVTFAAEGPVNNVSGVNWSSTGFTNLLTGRNNTTTFGGNAGGEAIDQLFDGFIYNAIPLARINLSGLTVGQTYVTTLYNQNFGNPAASTRNQMFTGSESVGTFTFNEDAFEASLTHYTFVATATTMTIADVPATGDSMHFYGLSNELVFNKSWTSGTDWTTAVWTPTGAPNGIGTNATFAAQGAPTTLNLDANQTVGHIQLDGPNGWTLSSSNGSVFTIQTDAGGVSVLSTPAGSHSITTPLILGSDLMKSGPGSLAISGAISGAKALTITGGLLKFGQANTYTGITTVNRGTSLDLNGTVQTFTTLNGAGSVLNSGSGSQVLTINDGTFAGVISDHNGGSGALALTKNTTAKLTLTNLNTYGGATIVNDGTLRLEGSGATLLTDDFTTMGNPNNADLNYNLAFRQTGTAAPQNWNKIGGNAQTGNATSVRQPVTTSGNYMLVSGSGASLNNMPIGLANCPGPLKISFDMFKGLNVNDDNWTAFALKGIANSFQPNTVGAGEVGFLYRRNTGLQIFSGSGTAITDLGTTTAGDSFAFYIADNAGTGSPFGTNGSRLIVTQGGNVICNYKMSAAMADRFVSFGTPVNITGGFDNASIAPTQFNILPATTDLTLVAATSALELENVNQTVASLNGIAGTTIKLGLLSNLNVSGSGASSYAGVISGAFGYLTKSGTGTLALTGTNTYTGGTVLAGGILNVAALSDYGVAGSLGTRTLEVTAAGDPGILFKGGTLQYTGATAQSTNRGITLATGGGTIDASGSSPAATVSFTAATSPDFTDGSGARTLTLTGSNTGANTFATVIGDAGGATGLTKSGSGTWLITGTNTFTGAATVTGGTLGVTGTSLSDTGKLVITGGKVDVPAAVNETVGTLIIGGVAQVIGTYGTIASGATHPDDVHFSGTGVITVTIYPSPYELWLAGYPSLTGGSALSSADPDLDGIVNLEEFAFGTDPTSTSQSTLAYTGTTLTRRGQPKLVTTDNVTWTAVFDRNKDYVGAGVTYTVQFSANLSDWTTVLDAPSVIASDANYDAVGVPLPATVPVTGNDPQKPRFFRVKISG